MIDQILTDEHIYLKRGKPSQSGITDFIRTINPLLLIMLVIDLFTPILIWKGIIPASLRWLSHGASFAIIILLFSRMIIKNKLPGITLLIVSMSLIGVAVALYHRQGFLTTAWGWWIMFQFPIIGLYAFTETKWPEKFSEYLSYFCISVLTLEVFVQILQYISGERLGDNLAGTFGKNGTGNLIIFTMFVFCIVTGRWLENMDWRPLALVIFLGAISSLLAELKLFILAVPLIGGIAYSIYSFRIGKLSRLINFGIAVVIICVLFIVAYNALIPEATPLQSFIQDPEKLLQYINRSEKRVSGTTVFYDIGRNFALKYGWDQIRQDPLTFLFGYGLGAGIESKSLGTVGIAIDQGLLGMTISTSLLVMLQELGILGVLAIAVFLISIAIHLTSIISNHENSEVRASACGLLLFTLSWPIWLWYNMAWTLRVPMLLYWTLLGHVLSIHNQRKVLGHQPNG